MFEEEIRRIFREEFEHAIRGRGLSALRESDGERQDDELLTPTQAGAVVQKSERTIRKYLAEGRLTRYGGPGHPRVSRTELRRMSSEGRRQTSPQDEAEEAAARILGKPSQDD